MCRSGRPAAGAFEARPIEVADNETSSPSRRVRDPARFAAPGVLNLDVCVDVSCAAERTLIPNVACREPRVAKLFRVVAERVHDAVALIRQGEVRAVRVQPARDSARDGPPVGDAGDENGLSVEQSHEVRSWAAPVRQPSRHPVSPSAPAAQHEPRKRDELLGKDARQRIDRGDKWDWPFGLQSVPAALHCERSCCGNDPHLGLFRTPRLSMRPLREQRCQDGHGDRVDQEV